MLLDRATTQNNLGRALSLGERESNFESLRQAEVAIQSAYTALKEEGYDYCIKLFRIKENLHSLKQLIEAHPIRASSR